MDCRKFTTFFHIGGGRWTEPTARGWACHRPAILLARQLEALFAYGEAAVSGDSRLVDSTARRSTFCYSRFPYLPSLSLSANLPLSLSSPSISLAANLPLRAFPVWETQSVRSPALPSAPRAPPISRRPSLCAAPCGGCHIR